MAQRWAAPAVVRRSILPYGLEDCNSMVHPLLARSESPAHHRLCLSTYKSLLLIGEYLASFYLDPYSRPAEKKGGAWMDVCVGKSKVLNRKPVAYLTCNGSPPVEGQPSLMTFREVRKHFAILESRLRSPV